MNDTVTDDLQNLERKYFELVWYARKGSRGSSYWDDVPEDIMNGAFNAMAKVEEQYPEEIDNLRSESSDWEHGFNSGMLAALRYVLTATCPYETEDEFGEKIMAGGLEEAKEEFPFLDT